MVTFEDVVRAAQRLEGVAHRTPVVTSRTLDERLGASVFLKCENLQRVGAFKFRGAYNAIARLSPEERARGVLTYSSGNHAQAIALASRLLGVSATIVMPGNAPVAKRRATEGYGASIVSYDPAKEKREDIAERMVGESGLALIPPYDHADVIAGQGTAARELLEDVGKLDLLVVPCGGGGLLSGSALSARDLSPGCRVVGVEPEAGDDATRSFKTGVLHTVHNPSTIADGARTPYLGKLTFPLILENVDDMVTVADDDLVRSMRFVWERMKLVVEPTGVLALAAAMHGKVEVAGRRVGIILSGGNVDLAYALELFKGVRS
ncbi:MAG: threo-3-hydroxy-L-aspartate ammonia-lyase [Acidobacteria bacterium]|jgi:threonine dehydratase|nr:threo-3-hydroxy-L-aspartate ammonia-lyase [Acidobacteriota bacterium]